MKSFGSLIIVFFLLPIFSFGQGDTSFVGEVSPVLNYFKLGDVQLLNSPFKEAQEVDLAYMMKLNPDRLLAPYRKEAGLKPKAPNYPNWESEGLDGHFLGHYLSALSMMYASLKEKDILDRIHYILNELKVCQDADTSGYLGGIPNGKAMWDQVAKGDVKAVGSRWVPWYNLHKILSGLRDAWLFTGNEEAKAMWIKLTDWCIAVTKNLSEEQMQRMLQFETGGMNKVIADLAAVTGEEKYLNFAERFSKRSLLTPLMQGEDELTGLHANTQIPIVLGFEKIAMLSGNTNWQRAASFFWQTVVKNRSLAFGGNSVEEHFNPVNDFSKLLVSPQGPESCNSYNMLKLTRMLYQTSGDAGYMDFYENDLYNHILSTENLEKGGFVYFTPARPRHYRVFSQPENSFWCCAGTGMENHTKYGNTIYAYADHDLYVNLFIPSQLHWKKEGITVRQTNDFPNKDFTELKLKMDQSRNFTLYVRVPSWTNRDKMKVWINGETIKDAASDDSYLAIKREWRSGDLVKVQFPMHLEMVALPGRPNFVALKYGPILLAARTGDKDMKGEFADTSRWSHIASGKLYPIEEAPKLVGSKTAILNSIKRIREDALVFSTSKVLYPSDEKDLNLIPFYEIGGYRYMMYWQMIAKGEMKQAIAEDKLLDAREGK